MNVSWIMEESRKNHGRVMKLTEQIIQKDHFIEPSFMNLYVCLSKEEPNDRSVLFTSDTDSFTGMIYIHSSRGGRQCVILSSLNQLQQGYQHYPDNWTLLVLPHTCSDHNHSTRLYHLLASSLVERQLYEWLESQTVSGRHQETGILL